MWGQLCLLSETGPAISLLQAPPPFQERLHTQTAPPCTANVMLEVVAGGWGVYPVQYCALQPWLSVSSPYKYS